MHAFHHRSGRVVAASRLVLAAVFLIALWLDPATPDRFARADTLILAGYVVAAAAHLAATWSDWRLECRLAGPAHLVDIALFTVLVFLTDGYTSPFFPFYVFLLLAATMRWNWRVTAATAVAVILLYIAAGAAALLWAGGDFDLLRLLFRGTSLAVVSLVLIWFGVNQQIRAARQLPDPELVSAAATATFPVQPAMELALRTTGADRAVFVWSDDQEPWTYAAVLGDDGFRQERHEPDAFGGLVAPAMEGAAFLFDRDGETVLTAGGRRPHLSAPPDAIDPRLRERYGLDEGLAIPVQADGHAGVLFALDVPGPCADDLAVATQLGSEISAAIQRAASIGLTKEAAVARARLGLTRDFHDRFLQLLAGASLRLEGVRKAAAAGEDVGPEIDSLQEQLAAEQRELRHLIATVRGGGRPAASTGFCEGLHGLAARLGTQWKIDCTVTACCEPQNGSEALDHDLHHLVYEAVANAVRHGRAGRVSIALTRRDGALALEIADDGSALPARLAATGDGDGAAAPWSLHERVHGLGGHLALMSTGGGSRLSISIPEKGLP